MLGPLVSTLDDAYDSLLRAYRLLGRGAHTRKVARHFLSKHPLPKWPRKIKPVYFFGQYDLTSFKLGGAYLIEALQQMGIEAKSGRHVSPAKIRDSILVYVLEPPPKNLPALKSNGNRIVMDMRDNFAHDWGALNPDFFGRDLADCIIFPNRALSEKFVSIKPTPAKRVTLYGYADLAIALAFQEKAPENLDELKCCYFGFKFNLNAEMIDTPSEKFSINSIPLQESTFEKSLQQLRHFNMHLDFRPQGIGNLYKPLTKILIAAECRSNIMIEKTPRVLELLPEDYPFLVEGDNAVAVMEKARQLFGTPEWEKALMVMDRIRETYSFRHHIEAFVNILETLS